MHPPGARAPGQTTPLRLYTLLLLAAFSHSASGAQQPNIILILSDDVGAETLGAYGGESYQTPNLDALARDGVRFAHGHAQPLCTPSRVKIMTGQYNFRNYRHFAYLDPEQTTFAHVLKNAGYHTSVVGKWQLFSNQFQTLQGSTPATAGFDDFLVWQLNPDEKGSRYWHPALNDNGRLRQFPATSFGPDVLNDRVLQLIENRGSRPFFIFYSMVLAHDPWVTTPDMRDEAANDQAKFAAMMAYMDKLVGNVRRTVESQGIQNDTLILFIGDNGTDRDITSLQQGREVRGAKGLTINAGSHVPFLAWGPGLAKPGLVSNSLVNLNDILPTLAELAATPLPADYPQDGASLVPVLRGKSGFAREHLFIHYEPRWPSGTPARYAFDRRWKLYEHGDFFDTLQDPLEEAPLTTSALGAEGRAAYERLNLRIQAMPGALQSTHRWLPAQLYWALGAALLVLALVVTLLWRVARRLRP